jgi:hypothetical protein
MQPTINLINHQEIVYRPSQIYFDGNVQDNYDIKIGGKVQFVARSGQFSDETEKNKN